MKFLNSLYSALYLFVFFMVPAQATEITATQLIASCSSPNSDEQAFCVGYIGGIMDGAKTSQKNSGKIFFKHFCIFSFLIPIFGNVIMILFIARARLFLSSERALQNTNIVSGSLLIIVGIIIALT